MQKYGGRWGARALFFAAMCCFKAYVGNVLAADASDTSNGSIHAPPFVWNFAASATSWRCPVPIPVPVRLDLPRMRRFVAGGVLEYHPLPLVMLEDRWANAEAQSVNKTSVIASVVPGRVSTYFGDESSYYSELRGARFALTYKKGGWDALRHAEIVSQGTVPLFLGVQHAPFDSLYSWPRDLLQAALHLAGVRQKFLGWSSLNMFLGHKSLPQSARQILEVEHTLDEGCYTDLRSSFLSFGHSALTASSLLKRIIHAMRESGEVAAPRWVQPSPHVLYLTQTTSLGHYTADIMVAACRSTFGARCVDYPSQPYMYKPVNESMREGLYARGMSYAFSMDPALQVDRERASVLARISSRNYTHVIVSDVGMVRRRADVTDVWVSVMKNYGRHEIAAFVGDDDHGPSGLRALLQLQKHVTLFIREPAGYGLPVDNFHDAYVSYVHQFW